MPASNRMSSSTSRLRLRVPCWQASSSAPASRSEEHTSELQSLMRISYAVFCLKKKKKTTHNKFTNPSEKSMHKCKHNSVTRTQEATAGKQTRKTMKIDQ